MVHAACGWKTYHNLKISVAGNSTEKNTIFETAWKGGLLGTESEEFIKKIPSPAFCCLWGSICHTRKYTGIDRKNTFSRVFLHLAYCLLRGLWYTMDNYNHFYRISRQISHQTIEEYVFV